MSKIAKGLLFAFIGALAFMMGAAAFFPGFLASSAGLVLGIGAAVGFGAGYLGSKIGYTIMLILILISAFSIFFITPAIASTLPMLSGWIGGIISGGGAWGYVLWFGLQLVAGFMAYYFSNNPTATISEALSYAVTEVTSGAGKIVGAVIGGVASGLFAAVVSSPTMLIIGGVAIWWFFLKDDAPSNRAVVADYARNAWSRATYRVPVSDPAAPLINLSPSRAAPTANDGDNMGDPEWMSPPTSA